MCGMVYTNPTVHHNLLTAPGVTLKARPIGGLSRFLCYGLRECSQLNARGQLPLAFCISGCLLREHQWRHAAPS